MGTHPFEHRIKRLGWIFLDCIFLKKRQNFESAFILSTCIGSGHSNLREKALN